MTAKNKTVELTHDDIKLILSVLEVAGDRGTFKLNEYTTVGNLVEGLLSKIQENETPKYGTDGENNDKSPLENNSPEVS